MNTTTENLSQEITEEEILRLIDIVQGNQSVIQFFSENLDLACRGWCTYVGLRGGKVELYEDDLYAAAIKFFSHRNMPIPSQELFAENIVRRMPRFKETGMGRIYYGSRQLASIALLSTPNKKDWYGLSRRGIPKIMRTFVDQDYVNNLSLRDQLWLSKFNDEYYKNRFRRNDQDLHCTQELKREVYGASNARNRDVFANREAERMLMRGSDEYEAGRLTWNVADNFSSNDMEDALIEYIDWAYSEENE